MSAWRERLAALTSETTVMPPARSLTELTQAPFVSNGSRQNGHPQEMRGYLLALAEAEGLAAAMVHALTEADVTACAGESDTTLRAYLRALVTGQHMDACRVPPAWGDAETRTCEGCGPVLLWPTCPPVVKACPWCFRRKAGKAIPRPANDGRRKA